jgi:rare lipoprotein A
MGRLAYLIAVLVVAASPVLAHTEARAERGIASMYAGRFVGRTTASGAVLDRSSMTAAHRKLPFGTKVKVTNKRNGRTVIVTVNDRGPHLRGRIIDLSPAAARQLGMNRMGLAPVEIRVAEER